ncbi:uncharacterized protein LOC121002657 [Bufo bufo]|uniref:uncharacterized protein LOC121002657 n=1 Tax=Bufo bufo TaxID=8384 RepID=UPI001ABE8F13|nr:uncharacterized protein LOC121002657 [Bufo bufo]
MRKVGSAPLKASPSLPVRELGQKAIISEQEDKNPILSKDGLNLVDEAVKLIPRVRVETDGLISHHHRRQSTGLGGPHEWGNYTRVLGDKATTSFIEHEGAKCCLGSHNKIFPLYPSEKRENPIGQFYHGSLPKQARGNEKPLPFPSRKQDSSLSREKPKLSISSPCKRERKSIGGLSKQGSTTAGGMEPEPAVLCPDLCQMGHSKNRFICDKEKQTSRELLFPIPSRPTPCGGCPVISLASGSSLCIPTLSSNTQGYFQDSGREGSGSPDHSLLAQENMVLYSEKPSGGRILVTTSPTRSASSGTSNASQGQPASLDGLETERSILRGKGFSESVISTLLQSRKPVTSKIYLRTWETFLRFGNNKWNPSCEPEVTLILDFLQSGLDKGLSATSDKEKVFHN